MYLYYNCYFVTQMKEKSTKNHSMDWFLNQGDLYKIEYSLRKCENID